MVTEEDFKSGVDLAATVCAPPGSLPSDPWTASTLGKYRIIRRLGHGGMGVVFEAIDPILQRAVAIKVLRDGLAAQPEAVRKFLREARTAARLNHPHVVAVYDTDEEKGICYLVMELMEGGSAHDRLRKWGAFGWAEATRVMADACRGLIAVHSAGLIHRDIKPSNIMRTDNGIVKLADFGLAFAASSRATDSSVPNGQVVGTPLYMSPEQCRGEKIDVRSDVYAMGATYYTLLTGEAPFDGKTPLEVMYGHCSEPIPDACASNPHIHLACATLIRRAIAKDPKDRPQTAAALLADFEAILALSSSTDIKPLNWATGKLEAISLAPTVADAMKPVEQPPRTRSWLIGVCLMLMVIAFGVGRYQSIKPPNEPRGTPIKPADEVRGPGKPLKLAGAIEILAGGPVTSIAFDPHQPTRLSWGTRTGKDFAYDLVGPNRLFEYPSHGPATYKVRQVAYCPLAEDKVWMSLHDYELHFFDPANEYVRKPDRAQYFLVPGKEVIAGAFHPKHRILAMSVRDERQKTQGGVVLRGFLTSPVDERGQTDDHQPPTCLTFSTDGKLLLTGKDSGIVQIWHLDIIEQPESPDSKKFILRRGGTIPAGRGPVAALVAIDPALFAAAVGKQVKICDGLKGATERVLHNGDQKDDQAITALAVSPRSNRLARANGKVVVLYDLKTDKKIDEFVAADVVTALAFNADGGRIAVGGEDGKITICPVK